MKILIVIALLVLSAFLGYQRGFSVGFQQSQEQF